MNSQREVPGRQFAAHCQEFARTVAVETQAYHADRWRRRGWWILNAIVVPVVLAPAAIYGLGFSVAKPPDVPSLFGALFVISLSCLTGGIYGGCVALALIAGLVGWELHRYPLSDWRLWLWFTLALLGYASVLILLYFRAPRRGPMIPPNGSTFFRRPLGVRRRPQRRSDGTPPAQSRCRPEPRSARARFAPQFEALHRRVARFGVLAATGRYQSVQRTP
jgi:hypothetical protein